MSKLGLTFLGILFIGAMGSGAAIAQEAVANVTVIHAVPADDGFPADVYLNGDLIIDGFVFEASSDRFAVPAGAAHLEVFPEGADPAADTPALSDELTLEAGVDYSIVAQILDGAPVLSVFINDLSQVPAGQARLTVRQTSGVEDLQTLLDGEELFAPLAVATDASADVAAGSHRVAFLAEGESLVEESLSLTEGGLVVLYAVGSPDDDSFGLLVQRLVAQQTAPSGVPTGTGGLKDDSSSALGPGPGPRCRARSSDHAQADPFETVKSKVLFCLALLLAGCATVETPTPSRAVPAALAPVPPSSNLTTEVRRSVETTVSTVTWASSALDQEVIADTAQPTALVIGNIGVDAPVVSLGVTSSGDMEVPENIGEVGWYQFGPAPGEAGSAVLAAHVDKAGEGPGVFFHLDRVRVDDRLTIQMSDGTSTTFRVVSTERVAKTDLGVDTLFASDGDSVIRLITCGGAFDREAGSYYDNIVVTCGSRDPMTTDLSFGRPPVTIIEIPTPSTTTTPVTAPPTTGVPEPTSAISTTSVVTVPAQTEPGLPTVYIWFGLAVIVIAAVLLWLRRRLRGKEPPAPVVRPIGAIPLIESKGFEAIEYRTGGVLAGTTVRAKSMSTFASLEDAIASAREARLAFQPDANDTEAWWVIWNLGTQRAAWIAEWGTPGESIVDLRTGQREPYLAGDLPHRR